MPATEIAANVSSKLNPAMPRCAVSLGRIIELFDEERLLEACQRIGSPTRFIQ
jgi:hypothetical protein